VDLRARRAATFFVAGDVIEIPTRGKEGEGEGRGSDEVVDRPSPDRTTVPRACPPSTAPFPPPQ